MLFHQFFSIDYLYGMNSAKASWVIQLSPQALWELSCCITPLKILCSKYPSGSTTFPSSCNISSPQDNIVLTAISDKIFIFHGSYSPCGGDNFEVP